MGDSHEVAGLDVEEIVAEVRQAIRLAELLDPGNGPGIEVSLVELTLKAYAQTSGGADVKFTIPFINQDFGFTGSASDEETHTIQIAFEPMRPDAIPKRAERSIKSQLVDGITAIRRSLRAAASGETPLALKTASVTLEFVLNAKGQVSLVVRRSNEKKWSNTVKLSLTPRRAEAARDAVGKSISAVGSVA